MNYLILLLIILVVCIVLYIYWSESREKRDFAFIHRAKCTTVAPKSIDHLIEVLNDNAERYNPKPICIVGGGYSHGGQTLMEGALQLDLRRINHIEILDDSYIEVGAGATWRQVISTLDQYDRSVVEMQSYWNFSVGGSISVNCHGRGMEYGTIADTIHSMKVATNHGGKYRVHTVYPNDDMFRSVVGGYGAVGIIVSVTLLTTKNIPIMRFVDSSTIDNYLSDLAKIMKYRPIMYNAEIHPGNYDKVHHIYWLPDVDVRPTNRSRLRPSSGATHKVPILGAQVIKSSDRMKRVRAKHETRSYDKMISVWRNYEMSHDTGSLEPLTKRFTTYVLQEYFIPSRYIQKFIPIMIDVFNRYKVNILNISLRVVKPTDRLIMNYTRPSDGKDARLMIAIVLYLNIHNTDAGLTGSKRWTRELINIALKYGGRYYLPYLPLATKEQFYKSYPEVSLLRDAKRHYDPKCLLRSQFITQYIL